MHRAWPQTLEGPELGTIPELRPARRQRVHLRRFVAQGLFRIQGIPTLMETLRLVGFYCRVSRSFGVVGESLKVSRIVWLVKGGS